MVRRAILDRGTQPTAHAAEVGLVARVTPPMLIRKLRDAASVIKAFSGLLEQIANLLRHLVLVVGWLILLAGSIGLLVHPHLSPEHLLAPGAGALAILQSLIKPRRRRTASGVTLQNEPPQLKSLAGSPAEKTDAS